MPFMKRKPKEEEDEIPQERIERNNRIVREVKDEPEYEEYDEEDELPPAPKKTVGYNIKLSAKELTEDANAHAFVINSVAARFAGLPPHMVDAELRRLCGGNIQRLNDINALLKH